MPACLFTLKRGAIAVYGISAYSTRPYRPTHRNLPGYTPLITMAQKPTYIHEKSDYLFR